MFVLYWMDVLWLSMIGGLAALIDLYANGLKLSSVGPAPPSYRLNCLLFLTNEVPMPSPLGSRRAGLRDLELFLEVCSMEPRALMAALFLNLRKRSKPMKLDGC